MRLSLCIQTPEVEQPLPVALLSGTFEQKLAKAAAYGAEGVELMTVDPGRLDAGALQASLRAAGLEASAVASGGLAFAAGLTLLHADPEISAQSAGRLRALVDFALQVGAPLVTIGSFRGRAAALGIAPGEKNAALSRLGDILTEAAIYAGERGLRLALEPLNRYEADLINNLAEGLALLEQLGQPALGLLLDTYHVNIEETSWTAPFAQALAAGKLFHVHLGDNNRLPPGEGLIDFRAILQTLATGGYQGYLSAELLPQPDPDTAARQTIARMRVIREEIE